MTQKNERDLQQENAMIQHDIAMLIGMVDTLAYPMTHDLDALLKSDLSRRILSDLPRMKSSTEV